MDKTIIFDTIFAQKSTTSQQNKAKIIVFYFINIYQNNFFNSQKFKPKQKKKDNFSYLSFQFQKLVVFNFSSFNAFHIQRFSASCNIFPNHCNADIVLWQIVFFNIFFNFIYETPIFFVTSQI